MQKHGKRAYNKHPVLVAAVAEIELGVYIKMEKEKSWLVCLA